MGEGRLMYRGMGLLIVLATGVIAALLVQPNPAAAENGYCPTNGIVPGSMEVISTNYGAGQVAGHTVRFQLCGGIRGAPDTVRPKPPLKIGLLWETGAQREWWEGDQHRFLLNDPTAAGITLRATDNNKVWSASGELAEGADPGRPYHVYSIDSSHGYRYGIFQGVTVEFGSADLLDSLFASGGLPLTFQFDVPVSARMSNPENIGEYSWLIVLYHDFANSCAARFASATSTIVPPHIPGELQLFPKSGRPGTTVTVVGNGFPARAPVRLAKYGPYTLHWWPPVVSIADPATTTNFLGAFEFEVVMHGFDSGPFPIEVQVDRTTVSAELNHMNTHSYTNGLWYWVVSKKVAALGDNFVRAFYYDAATCHWTFYDPEVPDQGDLHYFISRETYWLLVKEPQEVILNHETRNFTCTPEGNCWNRIVW